MGMQNAIAMRRLVRHPIKPLWIGRAGHNDLGFRATCAGAKVFLDLVCAHVRPDGWQDQPAEVVAQFVREEQRMTATRPVNHLHPTHLSTLTFLLAIYVFAALSAHRL